MQLENKSWGCGGVIYSMVTVGPSLSCPTLCSPMDCSPPGSSVHGISQARVLGGLLFPPPGDLPNPGIEPASPALQADSSSSEPPGEPFISEVKKLGGTPLLQSPRSHCQLGGHGRHRRSLFPLAVMLFRALENNCISGLP